MLYSMGLNLSNRQIAQELSLNMDDAQCMTRQLREGIECKQPLAVLSGEVEVNEVYVVAGHKGHPEAVKKSRTGRRRRLRGGSRPWHPGQKEVADSWPDPARRQGGGADAGECPAEDHRTEHPRLRG